MSYAVPMMSLTPLQVRILDTLRRHPSMSRADLARRLKASKPTITSAVTELIERYLVFERGLGESTGGRPPMRLELNARAGFAIGVDLGGTRLRAAIADLGGRILSSATELTRHGSSAGLARQLWEVTTTLVKEVGAHPGGLARFVLATPGVWDGSAREWSLAPNLPELIGGEVHGLLGSQLGVPIDIENDVNAAALGEFRASSTRDRGFLTFIAIGTGLGMATIAGGHLVRGASGRAGEVGYFPYGSATLEERLSGPGLARAYRSAGGAGGAEEAVADASQGLEPGASVVQETLGILARVIIGATLAFDPERVVLGGGLGLALEPFVPDLQNMLGRSIPFAPEVKVASLGDEAALSGAVGMAVDEVWSDIRQRKAI